MDVLSWIIILFNLVNINASEDELGSLPQYIPTCKRNDPNLNQCIINSIMEIQPLLEAGISELSVPPMEPIHLNEFISTKTSAFNITTYNVTVYGGSKFVIRELRIDMEKGLIELNIELQKIHIEAKYKAAGRLLIPLRGSGPLIADFNDVKGKAVLVSTKLTKDNHEYLAFTNLKVSLTPPFKGKIQLQNLFGGDKYMGNIVNSAINNNLDAFMEELIPPMEQELSRTFLEIANNVVNSVTYDQLFPNN